MNNDGLISSSAANENYSMISVPFADIGGGNLPVSALKIENFAGTDYDQANAFDWIFVWDNANGSSKAFFFCTEDDLGWVDDNFDPMESSYPDGLPAGQCFWYVANSAAERAGALSITFAGEVESADDVTFNLISSSAATENYSMLSNPYPIAWSPNNADQCVISNLGGTDYDQANAFDWIFVWDNANGSSKAFFFCTEDDLGWVDDNFDPVEVTYPDGIPAGNAFWYVANSGVERSGSLSIKFINPL